MKPIYAGNWKMHQGPTGARAFLERFLRACPAQDDREIWLYAPAVSVATVAERTQSRPDIRVGVQNVHWETKGAFTGETSVPMAGDAGATTVLVGHSERRHVFGESDEETGRKVRAVLAGGLIPMLCVGETLEQRERDETLAVVDRQVAVLEGLSAEQLGLVCVAYEPVWAIGTGRTATPEDASTVHAAIRRRLAQLGMPQDTTCILYGGSVKPDNVGALMAEREIDGVLVGGASLDPDSWTAIVCHDAD